MCFITIGDNVCGQTNGGCEQLCLQSPQSTIKCACANGYKLKNDSKSCLDIGKYFTIIMQVGNYSSEFVSFKLDSVYASTLSFVISAYWILNLLTTHAHAYTSVCHKCSFVFIISESAVKCQISWSFRCSAKISLNYEKQIIIIIIIMVRRGSDRMVNGFTTNIEFESRWDEVYSIQHYMIIKCASNLLQVSGFLRVVWFPPCIKLTTRI